MLLPLIIYAVYATSFTMSKAMLTHMPPMLYVGLRTVISGSILTGYTIYQTGWQRITSTIKSNLRLLLEATVTQIYIPYILSFIALSQVTSIEASLIYNISPCMSALFSYALFHEKLRPMKFAGLTLSMCALMPLFYYRFTETSQGIGSSVNALLLLVISVSSTAYGWILYGLLRNTYQCHASFVSSFSLLVGSVAILLTSYISESWGFGAILTSWETVVPLFATLAFAVDLIFTNIYGYLLSFYTATFMSLLGVTVPVFTSLFSWLFLNETMPQGFLPSCVIMALGLGIFYYGEARDQHQASASSS